MYVLWTLPAILGAAFDWPWWITVAVITVGSVLGLAADGIRIYRRTKKVAPNAPLAAHVPFVYTMALLFCTLPLLIDVGGVPARFAGLLIACDVIIVDLRYVRFRHDATDKAMSHGEPRRARC